MHDHMEQIAERVAASEHENGVLRANNAKLTADMESMRKELAGMRALMAEINSVLGLNEAEPADARTTLDAVLAIVESCDATSAKLERSRDNSERLHNVVWEDRAVELVRALNGNLGRFMDPPTRREILAMFPPAEDMGHSGRRPTLGNDAESEHIESAADGGPVVLPSVDLEVERFLAPWQGVNEKGAAVRLTHIPTGHTVSVALCRKYPDNLACAKRKLAEELASLNEDVADPCGCAKCNDSGIVPGPNEYTAAPCPECNPHSVVTEVAGRLADGTGPVASPTVRHIAPAGELAELLAKPQPPPRAGHTEVLAVCQELLEQRTAMGKEKYGTVLEAGNGRDALVDAIQEAGDQFQYLVLLWLERQHEERELARLTTLRPRAEWQESDGMVLWHANSDDVLPMIGWREDTPTLYYNWTPLPKVQP